MKKSWIAAALLISLPVLGAVESWQIKAPRGTDVDLEKETVLYYGSAKTLVEALAQDIRLVGETLEYQRKNGRFIAKGQVVLTRTLPKFREFTGSLMIYDELKEDFQMPTGGKVRLGPEQSTLDSSKISGNIGTELFYAEGNCVLTDPNGVLTSRFMDGDCKKGQFNAREQVVFVGKNMQVRSGRAIYYQKENRTHFFEKPVVTRDKEIFTAAEIIYDLKSNKVKAIGPVEYRSQSAPGEEKNVH